MSTPKPLHHLDQEEMWDVARAMRPDLTREEFDAQWAEFQELKRRKGMDA